ncbi:hypothetical protein [Marinobacter algicola]|uniref:hypothetical protein n=1 Tax=Marinobacter algicola TaxID=236100 RepID=UPI003BA94D6E
MKTSSSTSACSKKRNIYIFLKTFLLSLVFLFTSCTNTKENISYTGSSQFSDIRYLELESKRKQLIQKVKNDAEDIEKLRLSNEVNTIIASQLKKGKFISQRTSSQKNKYYDFASSLLDYLRNISESSSSIQKEVRTEISVEPEAGYITQYIVFTKYETENKKMHWKSYNYGMTLPIKTYMFRVVGRKSIHVEPVVIWDNPSILTINVKDL